MRIRIPIQGVKNLRIRIQVFNFYKKFVFIYVKKQKKIWIRIKMRIRIQIYGLNKMQNRIQRLQKCRSNADPDLKPWFYLFTLLIYIIYIIGLA